MKTTATLPDHMTLLEGEEFDLRAIAKDGGLVVTRIISSGRILGTEYKKTGTLTFAQKWGGAMQKIEDKSDPLLSHINEKHVK